MHRWSVCSIFYDYFVIKISALVLAQPGNLSVTVSELDILDVRSLEGQGVLLES